MATNQRAEDADMARKTERLFTIGYEQTPAKAVLDELQSAGVKLLVDVRAVASSRRPGFSKNQLAAGLVGEIRCMDFAARWRRWLHSHCLGSASRRTRRPITPIAR